MSHQSEQPQQPYRGSFPNPAPGADSVFDNTKKQQSIGQLLADTPRLFIALAKDEVESAKRELVGKGKKMGVGVALLAVAGFFALTLWAVLVTAAVLAFNLIFEPWASALIVAGIFLLLTIILALVGISSLKKAGKPAPERTVASVQQDLNALKGTGQYE